MGPDPAPKHYQAQAAGWSCAKGKVCFNRLHPFPRAIPGASFCSTLQAPRFELGEGKQVTPPAGFAPQRRRKKPRGSKRAFLKKIHSTRPPPQTRPPLWASHSKLATRDFFKISIPTPPPPNTPNAAQASRPRRPRGLGLDLLSSQPPPPSLDLPS